MNPAARLLAIVRAAAKINPKVTNRSRDYWPRALSSLSIQGDFNERLLAKHLDTLVTQVEITEQLLADLNVPEELYSQGLSTLKASLSPTKIDQPWSNLSDGFAPQIIVLLEWAAWTLKDKEAPINPEELRALNEQLAELQELLRQDGVPKALRLMLRRQMEEIQQALETYPITGIEPLKDALNRSAGQFATEKEAIAKAMSESTDEEKSKLRKFQKFFLKAAEAVEKTAKVADAIDKISTYGSKIAAVIQFSPT